MAEPGWEPLRDELAADVRRVADRLRTLSQGRLTAPPQEPATSGPAYASRAEAARAVASELVAVAAALEAAASGEPAADREGRELPVLSPFAAGDQLAVAGHDLLAALDLVGPEVEVRCAGEEPQQARECVGAAADLLADLRRRL